VATIKHGNMQNCDLRGAVLAGADLEVIGIKQPWLFLQFFDKILIVLHSKYLINNLCSIFFSIFTTKKVQNSNRTCAAF
jgi:uncharacterized protein YjbI with pentapeptide repeats